MGTSFGTNQVYTIHTRYSYLIDISDLLDTNELNVGKADITKLNTKDFKDQTGSDFIKNVKILQAKKTAN